ncbi:MAG: hypothetical protein WA160_14635 [Pseudobdellovibrio sp.]
MGWLILAGLVVISVCIASLLKSGIALRAQMLIKPTQITAEKHTISKSVVLRLFPSFQQSYYVLWSLAQTPESRITFNTIKEDYEKISRQSVGVIENFEQASYQQISQCPRPCWLISSTGADVNQLNSNETIEKLIKPLERSFVSVTWVPFKSGLEVPEACRLEKRLSFDCLKRISVNRSEKKLVKNQRSFFMNEYNEIDYFLFVEDL